MGRFRIKIQSSWYSKDRIVLRYSTNGVLWKTIKQCEYEMFEEIYVMTNKTTHFSQAECLLQKFNTIEKVKKYDAIEKQATIKFNLEISNKNKKNKEDRIEIYKKYS